jgi:hypothetical protein
VHAVQHQLGGEHVGHRAVVALAIGLVFRLLEYLDWTSFARRRGSRDRNA